MAVKRSEQAHAEDTQQGRYLTFFLEKELFGVEIRYVMEIVGVHPIEPIPKLPAYIKGVINLRSKIIPVVDMRLRFGKEPEEYDDRTCIIVMEIPGISVGLIVDTVAEVMTIDKNQIVEPPRNVGMENTYISGIGHAGETITLLLDCERLLMEDEHALSVNELVGGSADA